jgi:hypothetical protein
LELLKIPKHVEPLPDIPYVTISGIALKIVKIDCIWGAK